MNIILKNMDLEFPDFTTLSEVPRNNVDISCDGTLITYTTVPSRTIIDTKATAEEIDLEIIASFGEFNSDDLTVENTLLSHNDKITATGDNVSANVNVTVTKNNIRKTTLVTLNFSNPVNPTVASSQRKIHGFTGQITSAESIAWTVLSRLKASGKTNKIWNDVNLTSSVYTNLVGTRNPDCWAADLDISGIPIGNNIFETWSRANKGCLIAPQVGIGVGHYTSNFGRVGPDRNLTTGRQVVFKANDGVLHVRTIIASANYLDSVRPTFGAFINYIPFSSLDYGFTPAKPADNRAGADMVIYLLNDPLPATVRPLKFAGQWLYDNETLNDNSQTIARSKRPLITGKEFFAGMGYGIDQAERIFPVCMSAGRTRVSAYFDWNGHRSDVPDVPYAGGVYLQKAHSDLWSVSVARAYYDLNTQIQPLNDAQGSFYGADTFYRYYSSIEAGDSGTPSFFEGDGGQLCLLGLTSGGAAWLNYRGLPFINAQIDAMKTWAVYSGTVAYPQIMAKPTNTSKVERP